MASLIIFDLVEGVKLPDSAFPVTISGEVWPVNPAAAVESLTVTVGSGAPTDILLDDWPFFTCTLQLSQVPAPGCAYRLTFRARDNNFGTTEKSVHIVRPPAPTTTTSTTTGTTGTTSSSTTSTTSSTTSTTSTSSTSPLPPAIQAQSTRKARRKGE